MNKLIWARHLASLVISGLLITATVGCSDGGLGKSEPAVNPEDVVDPVSGGVTVPDVVVPVEEVPTAVPSITTAQVNIVYPSICNASGQPDSDSATNNLCLVLPQGSTADISIGITDDNASHDVAVGIEFTSTCDSATFSNHSINTTSATQTISTTYKSNCVGTNTISATVKSGEDGAPASVSNNIEIGTDIPSSISYVSSIPQNLAIAGTGGVTKSTISFQLVGEQQGLIQGKVVQFYLSENASIAGVTFIGGVDTNTTNSDGLVTISIEAGSKTTPIVVTAELVENTEITAVSNSLSVTGGPAVDGKFALSLSHFNPNSWRRDNVEVDVTATLADRNGQPVTDGTSVVFTAESGLLVPDNCTTKSGRCSVKWTSNPADHDLTINTNTTINTIMAEVDGTEQFKSYYGEEKLFDAGDDFTDIGDSYRDDFATTFTEANTFNSARIDGVTEAPGDAYPHTTSKIHGEVTYTVNGNTPDNGVTTRNAVNGIISDAGDTFYNGSLCAENTANCAIQQPAGTETPGDLVRLTRSLVMSQSIASKGATMAITVTDCNGTAATTCMANPGFKIPSGETICINIVTEDENGNSLPYTSVLHADNETVGEIVGGDDTEDEIFEEVFDTDTLQNDFVIQMTNDGIIDYSYIHFEANYGEFTMVRDSVAICQE